jgi:hypothetical protein
VTFSSNPFPPETGNLNSLCEEKREWRRQEGTRLTAYVAGSVRGLDAHSPEWENTSRQYDGDALEELS